MAKSPFFICRSPIFFNACTKKLERSWGRTLAGAGKGFLWPARPGRMLLRSRSPPFSGLESREARHLSCGALKSKNPSGYRSRMSWSLRVPLWCCVGQRSVGNCGAAFNATRAFVTLRQAAKARRCLIEKTGCRRLPARSPL